MNDYDKLIEDIDIREELDLRGIKGRIVNNNLMMNCLFHSESNPSFGISIKGKRKGLYNCFGCGAKGNFFHLISHIEGITVKQVLKKYFKEDISLDEILKMKEFFTNVLVKKENSNGKIRVLDEKILRRFKNPYGEYYKYLTEERKLNNEIITKWCMLCCDSGKWKGRIVIPIRDQRNRLISLSARKIYEKDKSLKERKLKNTDVNRVLAGLQFIEKGAKVILVEGLFDAAYLQMYNLPAAAMMKAELSEVQLRKLIAFTDSCVICLDGDMPYRREKNMTCISKIRKQISQYIDADIIRLPKDKDPNELLKEEVEKIFSVYKGGLK